MRYAGIIKNDLSAAPGVCLTFFTQGCSNHCPGCHNPDTWDFNGGHELTQEVVNSILFNLNANGINRTFCVMGGEPLAPENVDTTTFIISKVKEKYPDKKIYIWTGYTIEYLMTREDRKKLNRIFSQTDFLIDGPYMEKYRDITLKMRGSSNQRIIDMRDFDFYKN